MRRDEREARVIFTGIQVILSRIIIEYSWTPINIAGMTNGSFYSLLSARRRLRIATTTK
jgi:hypothetical protein